MMTVGKRRARTEEVMARRFRPLSGVRARLLAGYILLFGAAVLGSVLLARQALINGLHERIDAELIQEARELRKLARLGIDPDTGERFAGDVRKIFATFLARNVPSRNEAILTFVDGEPFQRTRQVVPYALHEDPELTALWGGLTDSDRGSVSTPAGAVEYIAVPLQDEREGVKGVFVVALFSDREEALVDAAVRASAGVGLAALLIGSLLAWSLASRVLRPVKLTTETARSISESDLTRRISVEGNDEVSELAETFNEMLDRLEEAFRAQRQFVDDAGHELRTPITVVRGHLELLDDDPGERAKTIALVTDELDRMSRFVNDLLLLARAEQPDFLDLTTLDVAPLTQEIHEKANALGPRDWRVEGTGRGLIVADRQRLTQAVMQLAQNAVQHTADADIIAIGSEVQNGEARFWVRDSGPGIAPEDQDRIFERFSRARGGRRSEGAGLGLSIVRAIAQAHHGRLELRSREGTGAVFTLVIPTDQPYPEGTQGVEVTR
jgi:two-component system OmpR family sensor kinase